jgi:hypothetical protein
MLQTEFAFTLPCGYIDAAGSLHREGVMRLATARDEMEAAEEAHGRTNDAYLSLVLLSRVITRLGSMAPVTPAELERLFSADFVFLQNLFMRLNDVGAAPVDTQCPQCGARFAVSLMDVVEA